MLGSSKESGSTATILKEIVDVFTNSGIETEVIHLRNAKINFCTGCKVCYDTGKCILTDDMDGIIKKIQDSKIVVISSPSYWGDVTPQMK